MTVIQGQSGAGMLDNWGGNTDSSGRLIKRGCTVSCHGKRYQAFKIGFGAFSAYPLGISGRPDHATLEVLACRTVQVVLP